MLPDFLPLYAVVVVLFSLIYFSLASLAFLLVRLDIPEVWRLFRGLFNAYFWMVGASSLLATAVFAASGRLAFTAAMLVLAATAMAVGRRVLPLIDTQQAAWQSGDTAAMRRLRMIHWGGMLANIVILSTLGSSAASFCDAITRAQDDRLAPARRRFAPAEPSRQGADRSPLQSTSSDAAAG